MDAIGTASIGAADLAGRVTTGGDRWFDATEIAGVTFVFCALLGSRSAYTISALSRPWLQLSKVAFALAVSLGSLLITRALLGSFGPGHRLGLLYWFAGALCLALLTRLVLAGALSRWRREGRLARRAVVVGGGHAARELIRGLDESSKGDLQILGTFDDRGISRSPDHVGAYRKLGRFDDLADYCRAQRVDLLIIALPPAAEERVLHILQKLLALAIDVRIAATSNKLKLNKRCYNYIGDVALLPIFDKPVSELSVALKALEDRVLGAFLLLLAAPVLAIIAMAIKLDSPGPVIFRQTRYGFNNGKITVYTFRSMYVGDLDQGGARSVTRGDPRVTRVGRFIRKASLDELPQLFNVVLKGNLSLVGPRPHALKSTVGAQLFEDVVETYFARHRVKPGLTGWAQINGWRGGVETRHQMEQRIEHDLFYIENWSILFDLRMLMSTPFALVNTRNAY